MTSCDCVAVVDRLCDVIHTATTINRTNRAPAVAAATPIQTADAFVEVSALGSLFGGLFCAGAPVIVGMGCVPVVLSVVWIVDFEE